MTLRDIVSFALAAVHTGRGFLFQQQYNTYHLL